MDNWKKEYEEMKRQKLEERMKKSHEMFREEEKRRYEEVRSKYWCSVCGKSSQEYYKEHDGAIKPKDLDVCDKCKSWVCLDCRTAERNCWNQLIITCKKCAEIEMNPTIDKLVIRAIGKMFRYHNKPWF